MTCYMVILSFCISFNTWLPCHVCSNKSKWLIMWKGKFFFYEFNLFSFRKFARGPFFIQFSILTKRSQPGSLSIHQIEPSVRFSPRPSISSDHIRHINSTMWPYPQTTNFCVVLTAFSFKAISIGINFFFFLKKLSFFCMFCVGTLLHRVWVFGSNRIGFASRRCVWREGRNIEEPWVPSQKGCNVHAERKKPERV